ncbi:MAG: hypothetical protein AAB929_01790 [Patescibacteria group bacterium]
MTEVVNLSFVFVGGGGPAGISGAHFLSKNYGEESVHVLTKEKGGNALLSNEYFRLLLHADSPRIWQTIVGLGLIFYGLAHLETEATGYLLEKTDLQLGATSKLIKRLNDVSFDFPLSADDSYLKKIIGESPPNVFLNKGNLDDMRDEKYSYLSPMWNSALFSRPGGKLYLAQEKLDYPNVQLDSEIAGITPSKEGYVKMSVRRGGELQIIEATDVFMALGPWIEQVNLPPEMKLPPGRTELHSIVNLNFTDKVIKYIAEATAMQALDPTLKNNVLQMGLIDQNISLTEENYEAIVSCIAKNIRKQLIDYSKNGPLIQNKEGAYITRTGATEATLKNQREISEEDFIKEGSWRQIMLGREGNEQGDLTKWPPHLVDAEGDNKRRGDAILQYSKNIIPPIDALLSAIEYVNMQKEEEWKAIKNTFRENMKVQSGFYHVTCGIDVTRDNIEIYKPLLTQYHEQFSFLNDMERELRKDHLKNSGIEPETMIDVSYFGQKSVPIPLYEFKYPFAVLTMDTNRKNIEDDNLIVTIPDADLPYMDVSNINGALVAVIGWLRGRGYMGGPGAALLLVEKMRQMREGTFNPNSKFGQFMRNFAFDRLHHPELMENLLRERVLGGTGDI